MQTAARCGVMTPLCPSHHLEASRCSYMAKLLRKQVGQAEGSSNQLSSFASPLRMLSMGSLPHGYTTHGKPQGFRTPAMSFIPVHFNLPVGGRRQRDPCDLSNVVAAVSTAKHHLTGLLVVAKRNVQQKSNIKY